MKKIFTRRSVAIGGLLFAGMITAAYAWWIASGKQSTREHGLRDLLLVTVLTTVSAGSGIVILHISDSGYDLPALGAPYPERFQATIARMREESVALRRGALLSALLIVIALIGGLQLFYRAATLSADESKVIRWPAENTVQAPSSTAAVDAMRVQFAAQGASETRRLVSTIAVRLGAVLLIVLLVQLLVSLCRYNLRLAHYIDSRADALELSLTSGAALDMTVLEKITSVIATEAIEFSVGKFPPEITADVVKLLLEQAKKHT